MSTCPTCFKPMSLQQVPMTACGAQRMKVCTKAYRSVANAKKCSLVPLTSANEVHAPFQESWPINRDLQSSTPEKCLREQNSQQFPKIVPYLRRGLSSCWVLDL